MRCKRGYYAVEEGLLCGARGAIFGSESRVKHSTSKLRRYGWGMNLFDRSISKDFIKCELESGYNKT
jgi:hypothetical protein